MSTRYNLAKNYIKSLRILSVIIVKLHKRNRRKDEYKIELKQFRKISDGHNTFVEHFPNIPNLLKIN